MGYHPHLLEKDFPDQIQFLYDLCEFVLKNLEDRKVICKEMFFLVLFILLK
jgi:hypothetical protein